MTIFGYGRVSTLTQCTSNQRLEIESAGFKMDFWFEDAVSAYMEYGAESFDLIAS